MNLAIVLSEDASRDNIVKKGGDVLTGHLDVRTDCLAAYDIKVSLNGQSNIYPTHCRVRR